MRAGEESNPAPGASYAVQREICEAMIAGELAQLRTLGHEIEITPPDVETILRAGFHKTLGARPMRAAVERYLQERVTGSLLMFDSYTLKTA